MRACTPFLLAPLALAGCGLNNDCWKYNPFGCAKGDESGGSAEATNPSSESTASPTTGDASSSSTTTSVDPSTSDSTTDTTSPAGPTTSETSTSTTGPTTAETTEPATTTETTDPSTTMTPGICGDGILDPGEQCDDGDAPNNDLCQDCTLHYKVFITSETYTGADVGGLDGADQKCLDLAKNAGLPGMFRAWLSTDSITDGTMSNPAERIGTSFQGVYELVNGSKVADGWTGLTSGTLSATINLTESGLSLSEQTVYTNTTTAGLSASLVPGTGHCAGWTSVMNGDVNKTTTGNSSATSSEWTVALTNQGCGTQRRLYCIQVAP